MASEQKGRVYLSGDALKTIILYAIRYANETIPEYDWKEVYGFLIGRLEGDDVHVDHAVAMTAGEATEVSFDVEHYSKAWELDNEIAERDDRSFVCGWWHTHPFKSNPQSLFLSSIDVYNHIGFQNPNPHSIALVHDPSKIKSKEDPFGVKIFRLSRTDFTEADLDRFALDLQPEGNTRSDEEEWVYHSIPFEIVDITPQLFFESLVDAIGNAMAGKPIQTAYKEFGGSLPTQVAARPANLTPLQSLGPTLDDIELEVNLPAIMEGANKIHVLPIEDYDAAGDNIPEVDEKYQDGLSLKRMGKHPVALAQFKGAWKVIKKTTSDGKKALILNEVMECYFWTGEMQDSLIESKNVAKLGEQAGSLYLMGNSQEFMGRCYLALESIDDALHSFQEARKLFESDGSTAKAGQCMEIIARLYFNREPPEVDFTALFLSKALQLYKTAMDAPGVHDPAWVKDFDFMGGHVKTLAGTIKELSSLITDRDVVEKISRELKKLGY